MTTKLGVYHLCSHLIALSEVLLSAALLSAALFSLSGCANLGSNAGSGRDAPRAAPVVAEKRHSITTTPLVVRVSDPAQLSTFASVLVLPPTYNKQDKSSNGALPDSIEAIAERELSVTVMGKRWCDESKERARLVSEVSRTPTLLGLNRLGVDAVLRTEVGSFTERRGSSVGGEPASVSFVMTLVRTADSMELWQGSYAYGQTYLSDNFLQLGDAIGSKRRGAGWSSGREIFEVGATSALQDLNARREMQFLGKVS